MPNLNIKGVAILLMMSIMMFTSLVQPAPAQGIYFSQDWPYEGASGAFFDLRGYGGTGEIRVYFDGTLVANTTAGDYWSLRFQIPDVAPGKYVITVLDVASNTTDTAFFYVPIIHVSPQEAPIGSKIIIRGEFFIPGQYISRVLIWEDALSYGLPITDEKGGFNVTLFVPVVNSGNYTLKVFHEKMKLANASFRVTIGLDTLYNALSQTQSTAQTARNEALSAKTYALIAMIFSIIAVVLLAIMLIRRK